MKTVQRKEVIKFYQIINHDEPVAVMSFRPPLIGVFTNQDALDSALKKKELNTVYTTTNTVKREDIFVRIHFCVCSGLLRKRNVLK